MSRNAMRWLATAALLVPLAAAAQEGDPWTLEAMEEVNGGLKAQWMDIRVEQVEVLSLGQARASSRLHRQPFRWVAGDARRDADGDLLTYMVDRTDGPGSAALPAGFEAAIDRAAAVWAAEPCLRKAGVTKRPDTGVDADIFDSHFGFGGFGNWKSADVVIGGWMPPAFFEAVTGEGGGASVLAMSVTFIFVGRDGVPSDLNGDGYHDTAANEIYFNDAFSWMVGSGMDVETVVLHELGHSLGIGHLGPPPRAAMNPVYSGAQAQLMPLDRAAVCSLWASWPR
jgi:hypothetical protein